MNRTLWARRLVADYSAEAWRIVCVRVVAEATDDHGGTPVRTPAQLALQLPADARLWLGDTDQLDAALAAEILLAADRNLEPYQRVGIAAFVAAERERSQRALARTYTDLDPAFERFRAQFFGGQRSGR